MGSTLQTYAGRKPWLNTRIGLSLHPYSDNPDDLPWTLQTSGDNREEDMQ
jgi:hypothetical protein